MGKTSQMERSREDALLVKRALAGDHEAYGTLVEKHQRAAVAFAYGMTGDVTLAEDAAQEGFIRAFQALSRLEEPSRFLPWLRTIVRNAATDLLRRRQRTVSLDELADSGFDPGVDGSIAPPDELAEEERLKAMQKIINGLRPDYREIVVLRYGEDMSYKEIADVLEMKVSAVGEKLSRVRNMLREKARRAGVLPRRTSAGRDEGEIR
jgi:RNA polymerase sigma factor (sigma-70 family)